MIDRRSFGLGAVALAGAVLLSGCDTKNMQWDEGFFFVPHRYALKVEVETPEGLRTGYSVIEVKFGYGSYKITGEAVAVDLPKGQTLFGLLRNGRDVDWARNAYAWLGKERLASWQIDGGIGSDREDGPDSSERGAYFWGNVADYRGTVPVPRLWSYAPGDKAADNYPYFVRFRDIRDPKSVEQVDPDNLAKSFGPGYRLKSLTATFTDAPVTRGIEKRFTWWARYLDRHFDGTSTIAEDVQDPNLAAHLASGDFSTEYLK